MKKSEAALVTINKAMTIDPKNPLCKFHRASILFSMDKHQVWIGQFVFVSTFPFELSLNLKKNVRSKALTLETSVFPNLLRWSN